MLASQNEIIQKKLPVDLVYPHLDTKNSRWFYFSSASRPFGMVNLSPDTQTGGAWGSGYRYNTDTIKGFSHIHAWQLAGISVMPVVFNENIFKDHYSKFKHENEIIFPGYHSVILEKYNIKAEISSTKRVGFHKYRYENHNAKAILFKLDGQLGPSLMKDGELTKSGKFSLDGKTTNAPTIRRPKDCTVYFHVNFNSPISKIEKDPETGYYLVYFEDSQKEELMMKVAISYTSIQNAKLNLKAELDHWDFNKIVEESRVEWNKELSKIEIEGGSIEQQRRFYTDLWHALQGRRVISDYFGTYPDNTGEQFRIGQLPLDKNGKPLFNHYNSDSFWGAQWTINTLWGLVYPEIMYEMVNSLMQYYKDGGMVPRGPSGGNYTFVMTGASSTPFIVSAIQQGIIKDNLEEIYFALRKNHEPGGIMSKAGYEHKTSLGGDLDNYLKLGYVPYPNPWGNYGYHQDGASLTLEYAYQDWCLAQLADKLNNREDYQKYTQRSLNYKNVFDEQSGWMRPKDVNGKWKTDYDPYLYENGFNESNGAQSSWFVPHDLNGLANLMGGIKKAKDRLQKSFENAQVLGFTTASSHAHEQHQEYSRIPINYGNQPSIHTAFIFNHFNTPWLTQYWTRQIVDSVYSDLNTESGYNGDEDQGLMSSLSVLMKIGLFSMDGGCAENPMYEIGSPIFSKTTIQLNQKYYKGKSITINAFNNSQFNSYIQSAKYNGNSISRPKISHKEITDGGILELNMSKNPTFNVMDFGAIPDADTINTLAFQKAIDKASELGGARVLVPKGKFLTGSLILKSNVELFLEKGAVLLGSTNPFDYFNSNDNLTPNTIRNTDNSMLGLIKASNALNISILGEGKIDGQGLALALNGDSLHHAGIYIDKNYNYRRLRPSELLRPKLFNIQNCSNINIKNLQLQNSASWGLSFDLCKNLSLDSLTILNRAYWNNDGIDITDCKNVRITNCDVNAADDGICLKSYHPESKNDSIYIANCTVRSSASAVKFGTGSFGAFTNLTIDNIKIFDTFRSAIAIESVDGAKIENIKVSNIYAKNTGNAIFIRLGHRDGKSPGSIKNVHISNMKVQIPFDRPDINYDLRGPEVDFFHNPFPSSITGIPGHSVENIILEDISITYPGRATKGMAYIPLSNLERVPEQINKYPEFSMFGELPAWGFYIRHAKNIQFKNVTLSLDDYDFRPAIVTDDVEKFEYENLNFNGQGKHKQLFINQK